MSVVRQAMRHLQRFAFFVRAASLLRVASLARVGSLVRVALLLWIVSLLPQAGVPAWAQGLCGKDAAAVKEAIARAESCRAAADIWRKCSFGAKVDVLLTSEAIEKCEKSFLGKLSPAGKKRYHSEIDLCDYQYSKQEGGTLWESLAAGCSLDVATRFEANPARASRPAPRASFDCAQARSALEKAVCSDIGLGRADIVLSRVFREVLNTNEKDRLALIQEDKKWRQGLPATCRFSSSSLPLSEDSLSCLRNELEQRFTKFEWCLEGIEHQTCLSSGKKEKSWDGKSGSLEP